MGQVHSRLVFQLGQFVLILLVARQTGKSAEFISVLCPPGMTVSLKKGERDGLVKLSGSQRGILRFPEGDRAPQWIPE